ncbi:helix-turn-helix transcriptional regulator [Vibrio metschnikovii]
MTTTESINADMLMDMEFVHVKPFTEHDKVILRSYEAMVDGLASLIGPFCEIVLHSLEDLNTSAIKIANGENTGRQVGSPITDLALKMLRDIEGSERNFSRSYFTRAKGGALMKSITVAIRNGEHRVIGLLCINVNLDAPFSQVLHSLCRHQKLKRLLLRLTLPVMWSSWLIKLLSGLLKRLMPINQSQTILKIVRLSWRCMIKVF